MSSPHDARPAEDTDLPEEGAEIVDAEATDTPSDDLSMKSWVSIGLFVLIAIVFFAVCLPLIM